MQNISKKNVGLLLMTAIILAPTFSYAQVIDISSDVEVGVGVSTNDNLVLSANTIENIENQIEPADNPTTTTESHHNRTNTRLSLNVEGVAVDHPSAVRSEDDLEVYTKNVTEIESDVERITIDSSARDEAKVMVRYRHQGKLFGLLPIKVASNTTVITRADGSTEVTTRLPWWSMTVSGTEQIKSVIEGSLVNNPTIVNSSDSGLSARSKAEIAGAIVTELKTSADIHASISGR